VTVNDWQKAALREQWGTWGQVDEEKSHLGLTRRPIHYFFDKLDSGPWVQDDVLNPA